jgi:hypothetical protein
MKDRYGLFVIAVVLLSLTRNAFMLFLPALLCTEFIFFLKERDINRLIRRFIKALLPLLLGTGILIFVQHYVYGSSSLISFITAQQYWEHTFSLPRLFSLSDWSHEGYGMNVPSLIIIGGAISLYLGIIFLRQCNLLKKMPSLFSVHSSNKEDYVLLFCLFSCISVCTMTVFFQNCNLHGLSRFILASPYFAIVLVLGFNRLKSSSVKNRIITFSIFVVSSFIVMCVSPYIGAIKFSHIGYFILISVLTLFIFQDFADRKWYKVFLYSVFAVNSLWSAYLFNSYLSDGWIFA